MTLSNPKPAGWATYDQITHTEMNDIGTQLPYAIDGNAGGTWNPTALIIIGGALGLKVTAPFQVTGASTFTGTVACSNSVAVANTFDVTGAHATTLGGTLNVTGIATFTDAVTCNSTISATGTATFAGAFQTTSTAAHTSGVTVSGGAFQIGSGTSSNAIAQIVTLSGAGRFRKRVTYATDANANYDVASADIVVCKSGTVTATRVLTLLDGAEGEEIELHNYTAFAQTIHNSGGAALLCGPASVPAYAAPVPGVVRLTWVNNGTYTGWSGATVS